MSSSVHQREMELVRFRCPSCCGLTYPDPSYTFSSAKEAIQTNHKWDISCILLRTNVPQPTRLVVREVQCQRELFLVTNTPTTPLASYTHTQGNWGG